MNRKALDSTGPRQFGVVGWPLDYSLSPAMHNAAISYFGINAVYGAFRVPPDSWDDFAREAGSGLRLEGFNVTVPYKEKVLSLAKFYKGTVALCRAANTLVRRPAGWAAYNTDGQGLLEDLRDHKMGVEGKSIVLLGAGGAARAALFALGDVPCSIAMINRSAERAQRLAEDFRSAGFKAEVLVNPPLQETLKRADLLINATSVGLRDGDLLSVPSEALHPGLAVYDMIYHRETAIVKAALRAGAVAVGGLGMLVNQGALAFELWFEEDLKKVKYDPRVLRKIMGDAARAALGSVNK